MIDYRNGTAGLTKIEPIKEWKVMFLVPGFGITPDLDMALQKCTENGINVNAGIMPVVAAITETQVEVIIR